MYYSIIHYSIVQSLLRHRPYYWPRLFSSQTFSCMDNPTLSTLVILHLPAYEDGTECSETSAYKIQTPGNHPQENIQHTEHCENLKSRIIQLVMLISLVNSTRKSGYNTYRGWTQTGYLNKHYNINQKDEGT